MLVQVRKKLGDLRRKSPLYALQWRGTPSKNRTSAILSETGTNILTLNSREFLCLKSNESCSDS